MSVLNSTTHRLASRYPRLLTRTFLVVATVVVCPNAEAQARRDKPQPNYRTPPRQYAEIERSGRKFVVEKELLDNAPDTAEKALARLSKNIDLALNILPSHSHDEVRKQLFWLMYGSKATHGGRGSGLAYFRPGAPKFNDKRDERWNSVVVVYSAENYVNLTDLWALKAVLHELAHAYQLEQWPEKEPRILSAYDNAMTSRLYHNVPNNKGGRFEKAYATQNQLEYFAEVSCMFFAQCNYQPFNRAEFRDYDPTGYRMIRQVWKIGDEHGEHEERTWHIGRSGRPLQAKYSNSERQRVTIIDSSGKKRTLPFASISAVDRDYILRWTKADD